MVFEKEGAGEVSSSIVKRKSVPDWRDFMRLLLAEDEKALSEGIHCIFEEKAGCITGRHPDTGK